MNDENKYENIIQNYSAEQLIYEASIVNEKYKNIYAQKKAIEEEMDRRLKKNMEEHRK